jgi:hypothetical protein
MTKAGPKATAALVAALVVTAAGRASANEGPMEPTQPHEATIALHVANYAGLSGHDLDGARARIEKVYGTIGVRIEWVDSAESFSRQDGKLHLLVMLLSREMAQEKIAAERLSDHVLGQAHLPSGRASIFTHRIATAPGAATLFSNSLGNVIAHEVGHLALQVTGHSQAGIMRANVDLRAIHLRGFDAKQAGAIRTRLMKPTAVVARRR